MFTLGIGLGMMFHLVGMGAGGEDGMKGMIVYAYMTPPLSTITTILYDTTTSSVSTAFTRGPVSIPTSQLDRRIPYDPNPSSDPKIVIPDILHHPSIDKAQLQAVITDATPILLSPPTAAVTTTGENWWPYSESDGAFQTAMTASVTTAGAGSSTKMKQEKTTSSKVSSSTETDNTQSASSESTGSAAATSTSSAAATTHPLSPFSLITPIVIGVIVVSLVVTCITYRYRRSQRKKRIREALMTADDGFGEGGGPEMEQVGLVGHGARSGQLDEGSAGGARYGEGGLGCQDDLDKKDPWYAEDGEISGAKANWEDSTAPPASDTHAKDNAYDLKHANELTHAFGWRETVHRAQAEAVSKAKAKGRKSGNLQAEDVEHMHRPSFRGKVAGPTDSRIYQRLQQADTDQKKRLSVESARSGPSGSGPSPTSTPTAMRITQTPDIVVIGASPQHTPEIKAASKIKKTGAGVASRIFQRTKAVHPAQSSPSAFKLTPKKGDELIAGKAYNELSADASPAPRIRANISQESRSTSSNVSDNAHRIILPHAGAPSAQILSPPTRPSLFFAPMDGLGLMSPKDSSSALGVPDQPSPDISEYSDATGITRQFGRDTPGLVMLGIRSPGATSIMPTPKNMIGSFSDMPPPGARVKRPPRSVRPAPRVGPIQTASTFTETTVSMMTLTPPQALTSPPRTSTPQSPPQIAQSGKERVTRQQTTSSPTGLKRTTAFTELSATGTPLIHGEKVILDSNNNDSPKRKSHHSALPSPLQKRMAEERKADLKAALGGSNLEKRISLQASPKGKVEQMVEIYSRGDGSDPASPTKKSLPTGQPERTPGIRRVVVGNEQAGSQMYTSPGVGDGLPFGGAMNDRMKLLKSMEV